MRLALLLAIVLMAGCMCKIPSGLTATTSTTQACPQDYIMVGSACCLDMDGNGVCDIVEATTSTTEPTMSTTTSSTTSTTTTQSTTTTTLICSTNSDCGQRVEERVCYNGDVYIKRTSPMCQSPGTPGARCVTKVVQDSNPTQRCGNIHCINGECKGV